MRPTCCPDSSSRCICGTIATVCAAPLRSICRSSGLPAWCFTVSMKRDAPPIGLPSSATSLSPTFRPACSAALPGCTDATDNVPPPASKPRWAMKSSSSWLSGTLRRSTRKSNVALPSRAPSTTSRWSNAADSSFQRRSDHDRTGSDSPPCALRIDTTVSLPSKPARAAAVPAAGGATIAVGSVTPVANTRENSAIASRKFAIGPAATIAMRL